MECWRAAAFSGLDPAQRVGEWLLRHNLFLGADLCLRFIAV